MTEAAILAAFAEGKQASERGHEAADNPHQDEALRDAWLAGWIEQEGPTFTVTPRARRDYTRPTMAAIWPADICPKGR